MHRSNLLMVVCLFVSLMAVDAAEAAPKFKPAAGCLKRWSEVAALEASLKGERKIPYDHKNNPLKHCRVTQPLVTDEIGRAGEPTTAFIVFDVTGSGRVVEQQLIGKRTPWAEVAQKEVSTWLFEPLVEDGVGITRVGVPVAVSVTFGRTSTSCNFGKMPAGPAMDVAFEVAVCAARSR
jgi:hypothetical protein